MYIYSHEMVCFCCQFIHETLVKRFNICLNVIPSYICSVVCESNLYNYVCQRTYAVIKMNECTLCMQSIKLSKNVVTFLFDKVKF